MSASLTRLLKKYPRTCAVPNSHTDNTDLYCVIVALVLLCLVLA